MLRARYYSPQLDRELVTQLFHAARSRRMPMTRLASALVRDGLARLEDADTTATLHEDPPTPGPGGRQD